MLSINDKLYKDTKKVLLGQKLMKSEFLELSHWIDEYFGVKPINVSYKLKTYDDTKFAKLEIVFFELSEAMQLRYDNSQNYDKEKLSIVTEKFKEITSNIVYQQGDSRYQTEDVNIVFSAFKEVAISEVLNSITLNEISRISENFREKGVWDISKYHGSVTILFYTKEQVAMYRDSELLKEIESEYFQVLKKYDELDCLAREDINFRIDSKEYVDNNYNGNMYYYYK